MSSSRPMTGPLTVPDAARVAVATERDVIALESAVLASRLPHRLPHSDSFEVTTEAGRLG